MISGEKTLISGITGTVARPLAEFLARDNEVWGVAQFANKANRVIEQYQAVAGEPLRSLSDSEALESLGIVTRAVDLSSGDFGDLPDDFTYVLHMTWTRADLVHLEDALRTNVEGAGLLLHHCRKAKAALVTSGMGIYSPNADPWHAYTETDPIGRGSTAYAPTSPASKIGLKAVARYCARVDDLPITIARLNTFMGVPGSFPGMHISSVLQGTEMIAPYDQSPHTDPYARHAGSARGPSRCGEHACAHHELVRRRNRGRTRLGQSGSDAVGEARPSRDPGSAREPCRNSGRSDPATVNHRSVPH